LASIRRIRTQNEQAPYLACWHGALLVVAFFAFNSYIQYREQHGGTPPASSYQDATYTIDGKPVKIGQGGIAYFGNAVTADLDGDGRLDKAFIITSQPGGSGTFYYAVAARNTPGGYVGSDGYLLGDRIAPQSTTMSPNPVQKYVVVFNYADRNPGEPMTTQPSVGKSVYLKIDPASNQWGIVIPNFEGESRN
jgi:hypothetical protein